MDPLVAVGRDGELLWLEGSHRFTIADILGVETVPVLILARHEAWQRMRDRAAAAPAGELTADADAHHRHPDISDVVD